MVNGHRYGRNINIIKKSVFHMFFVSFELIKLDISLIVKHPVSEFVSKTLTAQLVYFNPRNDYKIEEAN